MDKHTFENLILLLALLVIVAVYVTPALVAFYREHPNRWLIAVVNIVFGGTLFGWLIALVWALKAIHIGGGGDSGWNLFINDPKKVHIVNPPSLPPPAFAPADLASSLADEIEKLHSLRKQGVISEAEFNGMKTRLIGGSAT